MKVEFKTENNNYLKSFANLFNLIFIFAITFIVGNVALKLGIISKHYQIDYNCKLLSLDKSSSNFKTLSRLSNLKSKQRIWDLCREFVK